MPVFICQKCFKPIGTEGMTELDGKIYHKRCAKSITPPQTERRERRRVRVKEKEKERRPRWGEEEIKRIEKLRKPILGWVEIKLPPRVRRTASES